jgi:hypothetical protein
MVLYTSVATHGHSSSLSISGNADVHRASIRGNADAHRASPYPAHASPLLRRDLTPVNTATAAQRPRLAAPLAHHTISCPAPCVFVNPVRHARQVLRSSRSAIPHPRTPSPIGMACARAAVEAEAPASTPRRSNASSRSRSPRRLWSPSVCSMTSRTPTRCCCPHHPPSHPSRSRTHTPSPCSSTFKSPPDLPSRGCEEVAPAPLLPPPRHLFAAVTALPTLRFFALEEIDISVAAAVGLGLKDLGR